MNSRTREGFYALWTLAILVCLAVSVFLLIWASFADGGDAAEVPADGQAQAQADGQTTTDGQVPADGQDQQPVLPGEEMPIADGSVAAPVSDGAVELGKTADMGADYLSRLTFLGDSTTYGLYSYGVLPHYQIWTPASGTMSLFNYAVETIDYYTPGSGDSSQQLPIVDCAADSQPEYLVITLGINGVSILDETQFRQYYSGLIQDLRYASPNTKIICNSIYPVIDANTTDDIKNDKINAANGWIKAIAAEMGCRYLNSHDALTDDTGNLSALYVDAENDGIHMNAEGYNAVLQYARTHAWQ